MKLLIISFLFIGVVVSSSGCSGTQKPDPKVEACRASCVKNMDNCIRKAAKNEAKKAACEAVGNKCGRDCLTR